MPRTRRILAVFYRVASVLIGVLVTCQGALAAATTRGDARTESPEVLTLIQALGDRDGSVRDRASKQLEAMGAEARPALLKAIRGGDPERRARAAEVLLRLPWNRPSDPPQVEKYLSVYGQLDEDGRQALVRELYDKLEASDVLLRLLVEEPSDDVRWTIVALLSRNDDDPALRKLRVMDLSADDPPMLRLGGQAWFYVDRNRSLALFRRAIEAEAKAPSNDHGQLDFAFDRLIDDAMGRRAFKEAAAWLRQEIPREIGGGRGALPRLVALHLYFGPLPGIEDDLRKWAVDRASAQRVVAFVARKPTTRKDFPKDALVAAMDLSLDERLSAAYFLFEHKFLDESQAELDSVEKVAVADPEARDQKEVKTQLLASMLDAARGDDQRAADALQQAMVLMTRSNLVLKWRSEDDLWAEVYWRRACAAQRRHDQLSVVHNVKNILRYAPSSSDTSIEIIRWLSDHDQKEAADQLFDNVYTRSKRNVDQSKADPVRMNDLAWLCARCERHIREAVQLSDKAIAAKPESAAFLDTAAEAHFAAGDRAKAIELEGKALQLRPLDDFMQAQLQGFKKPTTRPSTQSNQ